MPCTETLAARVKAALPCAASSHHPISLPGLAVRVIAVVCWKRVAMLTRSCLASHLPLSAVRNNWREQSAQHSSCDTRCMPYQVKVACFSLLLHY
jgi:hypothetical protein